MCLENCVSLSSYEFAVVKSSINVARKKWPIVFCWYQFMENNSELRTIELQPIIV